MYGGKGLLFHIISLFLMKSKTLLLWDSLHRVSKNLQMPEAKDEDFRGWTDYV